MKTPVFLSVRRSRGAFALVTSLLILSLLAIVAVSYLSNMSAERQTAEAFGSKTSAEQAAQTGVDNATAMLAQCFRDFPDSATVWDTAQTTNTGTPPTGIPTVNTAYNEGTSLYLRAVPSTQDATVANPLPHGGLTDASGKVYPANDKDGNDPSNPACQTFVLPLISGVLNGQARLVSQRSKLFQAQMDLSVADPATQNWVDLNVRQSSDDKQGVIGSPPSWTAAGAMPAGPKPARAYWVNLYGFNSKTGKNDLLTGRYAYWIEDESFRANVNRIDNSSQVSQSPPQRVDNTIQPLDSSTGNARSLLPSDMFLQGPLAMLDQSSARDNASGLLTARTSYPGSFFPERRALAHASLAVPVGATVKSFTDQIGYITTTQSGTLNLSRHGTQRLNLNEVVPNLTLSTTYIPSSETVIQKQVEQIVRTIAFHLPNFGQRFYRTSSDTSSTTLNNATQVDPNKPLTLNDTIAHTSSHALIYLYKLAANIRDYIDGNSTQPTLIMSDGTVASHNAPTAPLGDEGQSNSFWAQGKTNAPFIEKVAVRYRPVCATKESPSISPHLFGYSKTSNHFDLSIDYYIEFWNMSDRDIYAKPQARNQNNQSAFVNNRPPLHLNNASVIVRDPQDWSVYPSGDQEFKLDGDPAGPLNLLPPGSVPIDPRAEILEMDLASGVFAVDPQQVALDGTHAISTPDGRTLYPDGIVFPAGCVTVITSDPSCNASLSNPYSAVPGKIEPTTYKYTPWTQYNSAAATTTYPAPLTAVNTQVVFYCSNLKQGARRFAGTIQKTAGSYVNAGGVQIKFPSTHPTYNIVGEVSLVNSYGYVDVARNAIEQYNAQLVYSNTWKQLWYHTADNLSQPNYSDFSYVSSIAGNVADSSTQKPTSVPSTAVSVVGDPRTNNEQLSINGSSDMAPGGSPDQSRYYLCRPGLGYLNNLTTRPDGAVTSAAAPQASWPDYFATPDTDALNAAGAYSSLTPATAPMVIAGSQLTSIGQLGDVYDPARLQATGGNVLYSRGGGRTLKIGQHDDRYDATPPAGSSDGVAPSNGWAAWRLADIFSAYPLSSATVSEPLELPGRININGILRDNGTALRAALAGFNFQPATTTDPLIHGDKHAPPSGYNAIAEQALNLDTSAGQTGLPEIVSAVKKRFSQATGSAPNGPFFERGELGELVGDDGQMLFGVSPLTSNNTATNLNLLGSSAKVDMNRTFDRGREELFRRLSELICTRGDTFTVYAVGQSMVQLLGAGAKTKVTGTSRMKVTFRLVPLKADGTDFYPSYDAKNSKTIPLDPTSTATITSRFSKPDHYGVRILETVSY